MPLLNKMRQILRGEDSKQYWIWNSINPYNVHTNYLNFKNFLIVQCLGFNFQPDQQQKLCGLKLNLKGLFWYQAEYDEVTT